MSFASSVISRLFLSKKENTQAASLVDTPSSNSLNFSMASQPIASAGARLSTGLSMAVALTACGGGGSDQSGEAKSEAAANAENLQGEGVGAAAANDSSVSNVSRLTNALPPTATQAARFLQQAQFASVDREVAAVQRLGYEAWLDQQFAAPLPSTAWSWLISKGYNSAATIDNSGPDRALWQQLIGSTNPLRQRLAFALSQFFVVSINGIGENPFFSAGYWDLLVAQSLGNFRSLLEAVTLNPAMGRYLNTAYNYKGNESIGQQPDQNYAREVMQLFTIGLYELNIDGSLRLNNSGQPIETYDQLTVANLSKVFTGWVPDENGSVQFVSPTSLRNPMVMVESRHDAGVTSFLGTTIAAGTSGKNALKQALDTLFNHPNVAPFFGKQMIQRLVTSNPSPAYVARVAAVFNDNGKGVRGDLKAVFAAILLDSEARSDAIATQPGAGKLREPVQRFVQWARSFSAVSANDRWDLGDMSASATALGQSPMRAGSVFNFFRPGYVPPNTSIAQQHLVAPEFQIADGVTVTGYVNFMQAAIDGNKGLTAAYSAELALVKDVPALLERLSLLLCAGQLSTASRNLLRVALESMPVSNTRETLNRVKAAVLMIMASPDYLIQL